MYRKFFKRLLDISMSIVGIVLLLPVFLVVSVLIFLDNPGAVFFTQRRVGKNKKYFKILKFRSMKMDTPRDMPTHLLENPENYLTTIGGILRRTSLDELPQLFNILRGDMSIVGPRPALWNQDDLIFERDRYGANHIRPGLTGWAQINGRDTIEIVDKARYDGEYAQNLSLKNDIKCIINTIRVVLSRDGFAEGRSQITNTEEENKGIKN